MDSNKDKLVMQSVIGKIHSPLGKNYRLSSDGILKMLPSFGGITYNISLGDNVFGIVGDHVEPGVSIRNEDREENEALNMLACIGNEAKVITGEMKGSVGYVTGKHGVVDHILLWFEKEVIESLSINDVIKIKAVGQGLALGINNQIKIMNIDPYLFEKIVSINSNGVVQVPIVCKIPSYFIGSGLGSENPYVGDFDIMSDDMKELSKYGIERLRFGDIVLIEDLDCMNGVCYYNGSITIGIIVHSDCIKAGHGPGVVPILTTRRGTISGLIKTSSNIKDYILK